eukprot:Gregarina_sp_Poly_1__9722@NODE_618_length_7121_cov_156_723845_g474_i0_p2_GENE_NODE_618_length_7121_cov_156_723845_g474_i0NODE_618_length_7121_cov_156_723845_g474_i0_p2_ORF_typecomplete_len487_score78_71TcA_TcB_BD/PF18276_1/1_2TcA_TcB_BD/PF18276_1/21_NODE_618_length_7121_cov_156_723845_g474_i035555015
MSAFVLLFSSFAQSIRANNSQSIPDPLIPIVQSACLWQRKAVRFFVTEIGDVETKITTIAEDIGLLKRLLNNSLEDFIASVESTDAGRSYTDDVFLKKADMTREMTQADIFSQSRKLELEKMLSLAKFSTQEISVPNLCDQLFKFMTKSQHQFTCTFKSQSCLVLSQMLQRGFVFLWEALNFRLLGIKSKALEVEFADASNGDLTSTTEIETVLAMETAPGLWGEFLIPEFSTIDFASQMAALLKPPELLKTEQRLQFASDQLSMSELFHLASKIKQHNFALAQLKADTSRMLLATVRIASKYRISSLLQNALLEFTQDAANFLGPNGESLFEDLSMESSAIEEHSRHVQISKCPPLALWLNSHYSVFNECRFFPNQVTVFLVGAIFRSVQALLLAFKHTKNAFISSSTDAAKSCLIRKVSLMSVVRSDAIYLHAGVDYIQLFAANFIRSGKRISLWFGGPFFASYNCKLKGVPLTMSIRNTETAC